MGVCFTEIVMLAQVGQIWASQAPVSRANVKRKHTKQPLSRKIFDEKKMETHTGICKIIIIMTIFNEETFSLKSGLQKGPRKLKIKNLQ